MFFDVASSLKALSNLDSIIITISRVVSRDKDAHNAETKLNQAIMLKNVLLAVRSIENSLKNSNSALLQDMETVNGYTSRILGTDLPSRLFPILR